MHTCDRLRPRRPHDRGGFTLLEVTVLAGVLSVGIVGLTGSVVAALGVAQSAEETATALNAARAVVEEMESLPLEEVFEAFSLTPEEVEEEARVEADGIGGVSSQDRCDDPAENAGGLGNAFPVPMLFSTEDDIDGMVGEILFPTGEDGTVLLENVVNPELGMPRDLNGDGIIDGEDHSDDYVALPVTVRLTWSGVTGERTLEIHRILSR